MSQKLQLLRRTFNVIKDGSWNQVGGALPEVAQEVWSDLNNASSGPSPQGLASTNNRDQQQSNYGSVDDKSSTNGVVKPSLGGSNVPTWAHVVPKTPLMPNYLKQISIGGLAVNIAPVLQQIDTDNEQKNPPPPPPPPLPSTATAVTSAIHASGNVAPALNRVNNRSDVNSVPRQAAMENKRPPFSGYHPLATFTSNRTTAGAAFHRTSGGGAFQPNFNGHPNNKRRGSAASVQLNKRIMCCSSPSDLLNTVQEHGQHMDFFNISSALSRLPKLIGANDSNGGSMMADPSASSTNLHGLDSSGRVVVDHLADLMLRNIDAFDARGLANAAWAFGKLKYTPSAAVPKALAEASKAKLDQFSPQNLANLVWSFVYMHHYDEALLRAVTEKVIPRVTEFKPQELTNLLWAMASMDYRDERLITAVSKQSLYMAHEFKEQELSNLIWAFGKLQAYDSSLFETLLSQARSRLHSPNFLPQGVSNIAWALAAVGHHDTKFFELVSRQSLHRLDEFDVQALSNLLWSLATLGHRDDKLSSALVQECISRADRMSPQNLANVAWACASLGIRDEKMLSVWAQQVVEKVGSMDAQCIASVAWAFASLSYRDEKLFEAIANALISQPGKLDAFSGQGLANIAWVFAASGYYNPELLAKIHSQVQQRLTTAQAAETELQLNESSGIVGVNYYDKINSSNKMIGSHHHTNSNNSNNNIKGKNRNQSSLSLSPSSSSSENGMMMSSTPSSSSLFSSSSSSSTPSASSLLPPTSWLSAQDCGVLAWSFAAQRWYSPALFQSLLEGISAQVDQLDARGTASALWAFAKVAHPLDVAAPLLGSLALQQAPDMAPTDLAALTWSMAAADLLDAQSFAFLGQCMSKQIQDPGSAAAVPPEAMRQIYHAQMMVHERTARMTQSHGVSLSSSSNSIMSSGLMKLPHSFLSSSSSSSSAAEAAAKEGHSLLPEPLQAQASEAWTRAVAATAMTPPPLSPLEQEIALALHCVGVGNVIRYPTADGLLTVGIAFNDGNTPVALEVERDESYSRSSFSSSVSSDNSTMASAVASSSSSSNSTQAVMAAAGVQRRPLADVDIKARLLKHRGWEVIPISRRDWEMMGSNPEERAKLLTTMISSITSSTNNNKNTNQRYQHPNGNHLAADSQEQKAALSSAIAAAAIAANGSDNVSVFSGELVNNNNNNNINNHRYGGSGSAIHRDEITSESSSFSPVSSLMSASSSNLMTVSKDVLSQALGVSSNASNELVINNSNSNSHNNNNKSVVDNAASLANAPFPFANSSNSVQSNSTAAHFPSNAASAFSLTGTCSSPEVAAAAAAALAEVAAFEAAAPVVIPRIQERLLQMELQRQIESQNMCLSYAPGSSASVSAAMRYLADMAAPTSPASTEEDQLVNSIFGFNPFTAESSISGNGTGAGANGPIIAAPTPAHFAANPSVPNSGANTPTHFHPAMVNSVHSDPIFDYFASSSFSSFPSSSSASASSSSSGMMMMMPSWANGPSTTTVPQQDKLLMAHEELLASMMAHVQASHPSVSASTSSGQAFSSPSSSSSTITTTTAPASIRKTATTTATSDSSSSSSANWYNFLSKNNWNGHSSSISHHNSISSPTSSSPSSAANKGVCAHQISYVTEEQVANAAAADVDRLLRQGNASTPRSVFGHHENQYQQHQNFNKTNNSYDNDATSSPPYKAKTLGMDWATQHQHQNPHHSHHSQSAPLFMNNNHNINNNVNSASHNHLSINTAAMAAVGHGSRMPAAFASYFATPAMSGSSVSSAVNSPGAHNHDQHHHEGDYEDSMFNAMHQESVVQFVLNP